MDIREFLLGGSERFKSAAEIIDIVANSRQFDKATERTDDAEALCIFQTSKQQTWLVATSERLYCVLDDLPGSFTRVQWALPKEALISNGQLKVQIGHRDRDRTPRTGLLDIGDRRGWLYTKSLFGQESIEDRVRRLITDHLAQGHGFESVHS